MLGTAFVAWAGDSVAYLLRGRAVLAPGPYAAIRLEKNEPGRYAEYYGNRIRWFPGSDRLDDFWIMTGATEPDHNLLGVSYDRQGAEAPGTVVVGGGPNPAPFTAHGGGFLALQSRYHDGGGVKDFNVRLRAVPRTATGRGCLSVSMDTPVRNWEVFRICDDGLYIITKGQLVRLVGIEP